MDARDRAALGVVLAGLLVATAGAFTVSLTVGLLVLGALMMLVGVLLGWRSL